MNEKDDEEWTEEMLTALVSELIAPSSPYVRFDEREDVLASLELLSVMVPLIQERPLLWKWMIVGTQSALQGAMVCALSDTSGTSVLSKRSSRETLDWLEEATGEMPEPHLAAFGVLLNRTCSGGEVRN